MKRSGSQVRVAMPISKLCALHCTFGLGPHSTATLIPIKTDAVSELQLTLTTYHVWSYSICLEIPSSNILGDLGVRKKKDWLQSAFPNLISTHKTCQLKTRALARCRTRIEELRPRNRPWCPQLSAGAAPPQTNVFLDWD